jgi:hypothetical protein
MLQFIAGFILGAFSAQQYELPNIEKRVNILIRLVKEHEKPPKDS